MDTNKVNQDCDIIDVVPIESTEAQGEQGETESALETIEDSRGKQGHSEALDKPDRPMPIKWQCVIDRLPEFKWNLTQAALAVGYSESYVDTDLVPMLRRDPRFTEALTRKKAEVQAQTWTIEGWRKLVADSIAECDAAGDRTNKKELMRMMAQHIGAFEADNRQKQTQIGMVII